MSQKMLFAAKAIKEQDDVEIKYIIRNLKAEGYDKNRLKKVKTNCEEYENKHGGSRGNRCLLAASEFMLSSLNQ